MTDRRLAMKTSAHPHGGKDHGRNVLKAAAKESQSVQCFASEALEVTNKLL